MLAAIIATRDRLLDAVLAPQGIAAYWDNAAELAAPEPNELRVAVATAFEDMRPLGHSATQIRAERTGTVDLEVSAGPGSGDTEGRQLMDDLLDALRNEALLGGALRFSEVVDRGVAVEDGRARLTANVAVRYRQAFTRAGREESADQPTLEQVGNVLRTRFHDAFEVPLILPTFYDNGPEQVAPDADAWARFSVGGALQRVSDGSPGAQYRLVHGHAIAEVFVRVFTGDAYAYQLAASAESAMRDAIIDGVTLGMPRVTGAGRVHEVASSSGASLGKWWRLSVLCPYTAHLTQ